MKKLDESEIINTFQRRFCHGRRFVPEDLEVAEMYNKKFFIKSDMLVQSTDVPRGMTLRQIARKSMVSCVSDFACKGVRPRYATVSLAIPSEITRKMINEMADGFAKASAEFGVRIIGGDVNKGREIVVDVSMFGTGNCMVRREGARSGDIIVTSGPFGYTASGLKIFQDGLSGDPKLVRKCRKSVYLPTPRLEFGLKAAKYLTSSMDSSDGLSITLNDMSRLSKKRFVITKIPAGTGVEEFAVKRGISFEDLVFCGGEEFEIVATVPKRNIGRVRGIASRLGVRLFEIGHVTDGSNVILEDGGCNTTIRRCGWVHFRS